MTAVVRARRARRSEGEWRSLLSRHQTSGLSIKAFCRGERITETSFYQWRRILNGNRNGDRGVLTKSAEPAFFDVGVLGPMTTDKPRLDLKLDLGDGLVLHLVRH